MNCHEWGPEAQAYNPQSEAKAGMDPKIKISMGNLPRAYAKKKEKVKQGLGT